MTGRLLAPPSGRERQGSQPGQGLHELGFPGPALGKMQSETARLAGEPSGQGEEAPPEGLGGYQLLAQTDAHGPATVLAVKKDRRFLRDRSHAMESYF